jgi:glycerol-3-phosphate dehydrogenase subunit C
LTRPVLEKVAGIDRKAALPKYDGRTFRMRSKASAPEVDRAAPAYGRKAVLYATCFVNYNNPSIGEATRAVLARNGVKTEVLYPRCCGMPQLEQGDLAAVASSAARVAGTFARWIDEGYDVIALVPSCALMLKFEWPLVLPRDAAVEQLSKATFDISEYIVDIARKEGLAPGLSPLGGGITVQLACHARAQNMGPKAAEMLRLLPEAEVAVIERCSGHGGSWGVLKGNFETAVKIGRPVGRQALKNAKPFLSSECPLAGMHIVQEMGILASDDRAQSVPARSMHPIELVARSYGIPGAWSDVEVNIDDRYDSPQQRAVEAGGYPAT